MVNAEVDIQANFTATDLSAQTTYLLGAYINASVGISNIAFKVFHTDKSNNGAAIKIAFTQIEDEADVITALSKVLRIAEERIFIMTIEEVQTEHSSTFISTVMNDRQFIYEIAIGPDTEDD